MNSGSQAGGTGIEPATCGFGGRGAASQTVLYSPITLNFPSPPARGTVPYGPIAVHRIAAIFAAAAEAVA